MNDETSGATTRVEGAAGAAGSGPSDRVGFCQDCGTALTRETIKTVGSGVFCEPCLEKRLGTTPQSAPTGSTYGGSYTGSTAYVGGAMPPGGVGTIGEPSPALAGLLGMIPGVGAVYNGQYAKGLIHAVVFFVLVMLEKSVSDVFGLFVLAWIIYQMVDAHHTAKARRDGLPLPDPFAFNEMGDRMGFGRGWVGSATGPQAYRAPASAGSAAGPGPVHAPGDAAAWGAPMDAGAGAASAPPQAAYGVPPANWAGYVHPSTFASAPPVPPAYAPPATTTPVDAAATSTPYATPYGAENPYTAAPVMPLATPTSRFPIGALWLIGLGVLVLAKTLTPDWGLSGEWIVSAVLAGLAVWIFMRRLSYMGGATALHEDNAPQLACIVRGPVLLLTLAVMFALQAADVIRLGRTWPILLIVFGAVVVMERTIGAGTVYGPGAAYVPPVGYGGTTAATTDNAANTDASKGGQG
ncbi:MAG: hypothetical protein V4555_19060 [Acidobacteriota bacterium]